MLWSPTLRAARHRRSPGDELEAVIGLAHEHRLEDTDLADRLGQRVEGFLVEVLTRLVRVRLDFPGRDVEHPDGRDDSRLGRRNQGPESPTQAAWTRHD